MAAAERIFTKLAVSQQTLRLAFLSSSIEIDEKNGEMRVNILFTSLNKERILIAPIFVTLTSTPQSFVVVSSIEPYPAHPNRLANT
jgi:hypothetical protein